MSTDSLRIMLLTTLSPKPYSTSYLILRYHHSKTLYLSIYTSPCIITLRPCNPLILKYGGVRMFSISSHQHTYSCRLIRLTIVMTISTHLWSIDIAQNQPQLHWCTSHSNITPTDLLTKQLPLLSSPDHTHPRSIPVHHTVCPSITLSSYSYTHTLTIITHLNRVRMISSHVSISLISYAWCSIMLRHISVQRIKVTNGSIGNTRSICLSTLTN